MVVGASCNVKIHYTMKLDNGEVLDSTEGGAPLEFEYGAGQIMPGLEKELEGMSQGEEKHIEVAPEGAFGPRNPNAIVCVPREEFPAQGPVNAGMIFKLKRDDGATMHVTVADVTEKDITLDLNHPLAGETLHFDVKIEEVTET